MGRSSADEILAALRAGDNAQLTRAGEPSADIRPPPTSATAITRQQLAQLAADLPAVDAEAWREDIEAAADQHTA